MLFILLYLFHCLQVLIIQYLIDLVELFGKIELHSGLQTGFSYNFL